MNPGDLVRIEGYSPIPVVGLRREAGLSRGVSLQRGTIAVVIAIEPADLHGRQDIGVLIGGEVLWVARGFLRPMQPA